MKISSIICEYNPFHNGHSYQINLLRQSGYTHIIAVISPNFVQRGDISIYEKRIRAKCAILNGIDLVIELPTPYAVSSAKQFAFGGVSILDALGCVDNLNFGSECGNIKILLDTSHALQDSRVHSFIKDSLNTGITYAKAREIATRAVYGDDVGNVLGTPNNILGIEYITELEKLSSSIHCSTIERASVLHDSTNIISGFSSATNIRQLLKNELFDKVSCTIPSNIIEIYKNENPVYIKNLEQTILYKLRCMNSTDFLNIFDVSEGLENRIVKSINQNNSVQEIIEAIKTKRYTLSRIRRIIINSLIGIDKTLCKNSPPYAHVLGFNKRGCEILAKAKKTSSIPISDSLAKLSKVNKTCKLYADTETRATDIFSLAHKPMYKMGYEYTANCIKIL